MSLNIIDRSWKAVTQTTMNGVWKNIWSESVVSKQKLEDIIEACKVETVKNFHEIGFQHITTDDINQFLESHGTEMTNEELFQLKYSSCADEDLIQSSNSKSASTEIDRDYAEILKSFLLAAENLKDLPSEVEKDKKRCDKFKSSIDGIMAYYKQMLNDIEKQ